MGMFKEALKEAPETGSTMKLANGENQLRILTEPKYIETMFKGNINRKWLTYVLDRKDGNKAKLFFMPRTIVEAIGDCEENNFYKFDTLPMPYDIIIKAKNAGTISAEYTVMASPKPEPLTAEEQAVVKALKPIDEVVARLLEAQSGAGSEAATGAAA